MTGYINFFTAILAFALPLVGATQENKQAQKKIKRNWSLVVSTDRMTDKKICTIHYLKDKNIWYSDRDILYIDYTKRGGVAGYQYRVDNRPPADYKLTTRGNNDAVKISVWYRNFLDGSVLKINGQTVLKDQIILDIDLKGLKEEREKMSKECELMNISYQTPGDPYGRNPEAAPSKNQPEEN